MFMFVSGPSGQQDRSGLKNEGENPFAHEKSILGRLKLVSVVEKKRQSRNPRHAQYQQCGLRGKAITAMLLVQEGHQIGQ
jgi:hypothetical protein